MFRNSVYFVLSLCALQVIVSGENCKFGSVLDPAHKANGNSSECMQFHCAKNEDCKTQFGESTQCLPDGSCGCMKNTEIVDERSQQCSGKAIKCALGHCPDASNCYNGECFCNIGYYGVENAGMLNCLRKNCSQTPHICSSMFGDNSKCDMKESLCQCTELHYYDPKTKQCIHQMKIGLSLGVAAAFLVVVIGPIIFFSIIF